MQDFNDKRRVIKIDSLKGNKSIVMSGFLNSFKCESGINKQKWSNGLP